MSLEMRRARSRQMLIFLLVIIGIAVLLGRLFYWQVLQSQSGYQLAKLANNEHLQNQIVNAPRGIIYDIEGHILATNIVRDDLYFEPIQFGIDHSDNFEGDLKLLINTLRQVVPTVRIDRLLAGIDHHWPTVRVAVRIEPQQSEQLAQSVERGELQKLGQPDIFLEPRTWRIYPGNNLAAQVLGYVSEDENNAHGVYGIEGQYNELLAGKPGSFSAETDLSGNPLVVGVNAQQPAVDGANLTLTINSTIQYMVQTGLADTVKNLKAQGGTVIVLNAHTGAVVAMAGEPTFDPNHYGDFANEKGCLGSEGVFLNPALYCAYEPGSTMKAVTMAAALDQGLITPGTTLYDPGYIKLGDAPIVWNWNGRAYGIETMTQVLEHSANVGAAYVAYKVLGPDRYYPYLKSFGFGEPTDVDSPEAAGFYRSPGSQDWTSSDLTRQAFGQSILATPLQVALAYETIANGGVMMRPYLVTNINDNGHTVTLQPQVVRRVISARTAQVLTGMLVQVAIDGSAQSALVPGYTVAAKTGTATTQGFAVDQTEASVAGFLPASNPQFVILVKIDRPQATIYGGTAAAPLWKAIAQQLMWYYHVPPDRP